MKVDIFQSPLEFFEMLKTKIFRQHSIIVLNIKVGIKNSIVRKIFSRFGRIIKMKTMFCKNKTIAALIRYENDQAVHQAINRDINVWGITLTVRKAFSKRNNGTTSMPEAETSNEPEDILELHPTNEEVMDIEQDESCLVHRTVCNCHLCNKNEVEISIKNFQDLVRAFHGIQLKRNTSEQECVELKASIEEIWKDLARLVEISI